MAKPKLTHSGSRLIISFWDEGPKDDTGTDADMGGLEVILLIIVIWFIHKNVITLDSDAKTLTYSKKKIFRKQKSSVYSYHDIKSLQKEIGRKKGRLTAETTENIILALTPEIKKKRLEKVTKAVAEALEIEPLITEIR